MATPLRRVYDNVRVGQIVLRDAARLRDILAILIRHGFGFVVEGLELPESWWSNKLLEWRQRKGDLPPLGRRVVLALRELGPTFIKLGQMLSTRPDLFPASLVEELATLQDDAGSLPFSQVQAALREELGRDPHEVFEIDEQPLATASIAQVHAARLREGGESVVLKIQRPSLLQQIEADLEIMSFLARMLETNFPEARTFSPTAVVLEFERAILREVDFTLERENLERFRTNFADDASVHFPASYPHLSSTRVLTMERIVGTKITETRRDDDGVDALVETGLRAILKMIFEDGFFHGDLHPGNLIVRDDGVLCFLDVGLCGSLTPRQRDTLTDMMSAIVLQDFERLARLCWDASLHGKETTTDYERFEKDVIERAERRFAGKTLADLEISEVLNDLVTVSLAHHIRIPADYTMTFKAMVTIEGVGKQLKPDLDLLSAARPFAERLIAQRYQPQKLVEAGYVLLRDLASTAGSLPQTSRAILDDLRAGRTTVRVESDALGDLARVYRKTEKRKTAAQLGGIAALCGTLLAVGSPSSLVLGLPAGALAFYVVAAGLIGWWLLGRDAR